MHHSLATLLSLSTLIYAESNASHRLVRRVPLATDLFSFSSANSPGSCTEAQQALVSSWIEDAITLNNAALSAYRFNIGMQDAVHLRFIMGIEFSSPTPEDPVPTPVGVTNEDNYLSIIERLGNVQKFLTGNGLPDAQGLSRPFFFCSDDFGQYVPWNEPAQDKNGHNVPNPQNENKPFTVGGLFPSLVNKMQGKFPVQPFWANIFNGYVFSGTDSQRMCFDDLFAAAPRSRSANSVISGVDIEVGTFERFIYFCDKGWNMRPGTTNPMASLADIITYANYPTGGSTAQNLNDLMPISSTFYHELFHLTEDPMERTNDHYMGVKEIFTAANQENRGLIVDNPESYNFFAVASYLARNPPKTPAGSVEKHGVMFVGGIPINAIEEK